MASERIQGEEPFHSKKYLLEMPRCQAQMRLQSATQKPNFLMGKAISKSSKLHYSNKCSCTFPHNYA